MHFWIAERRALGGENVGNHTVREFAVAIGILIVVALSASANAGTLKNGSSGASVTGSLPGQVLWTDYAAFDQGNVCEAFLSGLTVADPATGELCATINLGDSIIRLINPNGAANTGITGESGQPVCAMLYVFDDAQEMEECCGCPISSAGMLSFSADYNLQSNGVFGNDDDLEQGVIAVVAATPNATITTLGSPSNGHGCTVGQSGACNFGCDPTNNPGYTVTTANNLLGSRIYSNGTDTLGPPGLTETALHDDDAGDPNNLIYLKNECGELVGNGSGAGICSCPVPGEAQPVPD